MLIAESFILMTGGPFAFWRWLTHKDRHERLVKEIADLRYQLSAPLTINYNPVLKIDGQEVQIVKQDQDNSRVVHFGTIYGDLTVDFSDPDEAVWDVQDWLIKNKLQAAPSGDVWRKALERNREGPSE